MSGTFTIELEELTGVEDEIRSVNDTAMKLRARDPQAALDWLNQSEHLVEQVSITRQGRFHNQRALALKALGEYDRAILEFDRAAYCFEQTGEAELRGMVHNNTARAYSLAGNYTRAHESVDKAIRLAKKPEYLVQWVDQKANVFADEGNFALAQIESDKALALLVGGEQFELLAECLATKRRIETQANPNCATVQSVLMNPARSPSSTPDLSRGDAVPLTPLECVQRIIRDNYDLALPLFALMVMIADPDGNPERFSGADAAMQFLFVRTPRGEADCKSYIEELQHKPQEVGELSS